jgi:hypothetical protein
MLFVKPNSIAVTPSYLNVSVSVVWRFVKAKKIACPIRNTINKPGLAAMMGYVSVGIRNALFRFVATKATAKAQRYVKVESV